MTSSCHAPRILALLLFGIFACSSKSTTGSGTSSGTGSDDTSQTTSDSGTKKSSHVSEAGALPTSETHLTGTLGKLGAAKDIVSSLAISNSGETLIYLSSAELTCELLAKSRWLGSAPAGAQVVELIVKGAPKLSTYDVPPAEVNYAEGGKSSAYEVAASSGSITFTTAETNGVVEGTVTATYDNGDTIDGTFHATFCDGGQGY